jgi:hypothetical protein
VIERRGADSSMVLLVACVRSSFCWTCSSIGALDARMMLPAARVCVGCALTRTTKGLSTGARDPCCDMLECARAQLRCDRAYWEGLISLNCRKRKTTTKLFFFFLDQHINK